jgi:P27 family predicted phage terminase small subunit
MEGTGMYNLKCPNWLSKEAKKEWHRIVPTLKNVCALDMVALSIYCNSYARFVDATNKLKNEGDILIDDKGHRYINPLVNVVLAYGRTMDSYAKKFKISTKIK